MVFSIDFYQRLIFKTLEAIRLQVAVCQIVNFSKMINLLWRK